MADATQPTVTLAEAEALARRQEFDWIKGDHAESLRAAMSLAIEAGRKVPRVASRMDQPAPAFRAPGRPTR